MRAEKFIGNKKEKFQVIQPIEANAA